jgi:hypothetical protein
MIICNRLDGMMHERAGVEFYSMIMFAFIFKTEKKYISAQLSTDSVSHNEIKL